MVANVKDFGATGNGTTDDIIAINAALATIPITGGQLYFPAGNYKITSPLDLSNRNSLKVIGDGIMSGGPGKGSSIIGDIATDLVLGVNLKSFFIHGISFRNTSALSQSALHVEGFVNGVTEWCQFVNKGKYGLYAPQNTFTFHVKDCTFNGSGNTGIGAMLSGGHTTVDSCDITGWNEGIRACGTTVNITGCRIEVNTIGLRLGAKPDGSNFALSRSFISGNSFEANGIGIQLQVVQATVFSGMSITGTTGQIGILVMTPGDKFLVFDAVTVSGTYSDVGIKILGATSQRWRLVQSPSWNIAAGLTDVVFDGCNNP